MSRLTDLFKRVTDMLDFLGPLVEFARSFRGFTGFVAFVLLAVVVLVSILFSQGSFDQIIANFDKLSGQQFYSFLILTGAAVFVLVVLALYLIYQESSRSRPVPDGPGLNPPVKKSPGTQQSEWGVGIVTGPGLIYEGDNPVNPAGNPADRVYISYGHRRAEAEVARRLADTLRQQGFYVWPLDGDRARARLDLETEQAIRRSDFVVVLVSRSLDYSPLIRIEVEFASEIQRQVAPVLMEPGIQFSGGADRTHAIKLFEDWSVETERLEAWLHRLGNSRTFDPNTVTTIFTPRTYTTRPHENPFLFGGAVKEDLFFGRAKILDTVSRRLGGSALQSLSVVANRRMGKTSLLNYITGRYFTLLPAEYHWVVVYMDMTDARAHRVSGIMRLLRRGIVRQLGRDLWAEQYDGDLSVMSEHFEDLAENDHVRLVLCLDEWESVMAYPELNEFIEQLRVQGNQSRLGMVVATAHELNDLTRVSGMTSPFYNIFDTAYLGLMPTEEWQELVRMAFERSGHSLEARELNLIGDLAGGHPCLTQLAGSMVWDAQQNGATEAELRRYYAHQARSIFASLWNRQTEQQKVVVREVLGISMRMHVPEDVWDGLTLRGVLTEQAEIFCEPFADYILSLEL